MEDKPSQRKQMLPASCFNRLKFMYLQKFIVLLGLFIVSVSFAVGQSETSPVQQADTRDEATRPGRLLSEGTNKIPTGNLKVLTYKLEEITPTRSLKIKDSAIKSLLPVDVAQLSALGYLTKNSPNLITAIKSESIMEKE